MKKIKVRCYKAFANVFPGVYNLPVFYFVYDGWSNYSFASCINCGELYIINWENPEVQGVRVNEIAAGKKCIKCNSELGSTLKPYPQFIKLPNGQIGSYSPSNHIPADEESLILEFFEIG